jgi:type II secretory pathway component PulF
MEWIIFTWPTLCILAIALWVALRLNYGARGPNPGDPVYVVVNTTAWVLMVIGLVPAIVIAGASIVGLILLALAAVTAVEFIVERRAAQRRSICKLLALTIARGHQVESSALFFGESFRGVAGRAARRLVETMRNGVPIDAAILRNPKALPAEAPAYIAAGNTKAARAAALEELSQVERSPLAAVWRTTLERLTYLAIVTCVLIGIATFMMIAIVPQLNAIFVDFGLELPLMTRFVIHSSEFFMRYLAIPLTILAPWIIVGVMVTGVLYLADVSLLRPISDRILAARRTSDVLRILAIAAQERQPLNDVLSRIARVHPSALIRRRLGRAALAADHGGDWLQSLADARIVSQAEQALLQTAQKVGNIPWTLRAIAERRTARSTFRLSAMLQLLFPGAIILLATMIGVFVVAMFIPLVNLIHSLAKV